MVRGILFLSTPPPRGAARTTPRVRLSDMGSLSPLPPRGATCCRWCSGWQAVISIHAPREGSDGNEWYKEQGLNKISIHAPREGSDLKLNHCRTLHFRFLSTLPARGATRSGHN